MNIRKKSKLRSKLFALILASMLLLLVCMGTVFALFTNQIRKQEKRSLTNYSHDMKQVYYEDQKLVLSKETWYSVNWLSYLAGNHFYAVTSQETFELQCMSLLDTYCTVTEKVADCFPDNEVLFIYHGDYFFCANGYSEEYAEQLLNEIYGDDRRQSEIGGHIFPDGVTWMKKSIKDYSFLRTDNALISIGINTVYDMSDNSPVKLCIIKTDNNRLIAFFIMISSLFLFFRDKHIITK